MMSANEKPDLWSSNIIDSGSSDDQDQKQPSSSASLAQRVPRHERQNTICSRTSNSISIPHESQVVDRILSLFRDPERVMRFSFETRSNPNVPFHRQGDLSTISASEKQARMQMLQNRAIRRVIDRIWDLFKFKDVRHGVSREQYTEFYQLVSRTLRSDSHVTQIQGVASRDWLHDCSSNHGIQLGAWRESIFELVDLWELGSDPPSYIAFLDTLLSRIADPVSPLHIHKAIAKSWKTSAATSDAKLLKWALANVELKFRTLKDVPETKLGTCDLSLYSADQHLQDEINIHQNDSLGINNTQTTSSPLPVHIDENVLARLEEFLVNDGIHQIAAEDKAFDVSQILTESRIQFTACMEKYERSRTISLESSCKDSNLTPEADLVRRIYAFSEKSQQREKDRPQYEEDLRQAVDVLQWDILKQNSLVQGILTNDMLPRMERVWNTKSP